MSPVPSAVVEAAYLSACRAELDALKPGNVHVHAAGHRMTVADFQTSAEVSTPFIAAPGRSVGARILAAVAATRTATGQNTNLGILLLAAPLAAAAELPAPLTEGLAAVLAELTVEDAVLAYEAIRLASPAGLGSSGRHDVTDQPTVTLLEAMRAAADRDMIARQYATCYADVLDIGVARLRACRAAGWSDPWATAATYLAFLVAFPDTHVARKHGTDSALRVQRQARPLDADMRAAADPALLLDRLLDFDRELKNGAINPGTSADLTVASHFAAALLAWAADAAHHRNF